MVLRLIASLSLLKLVVLEAFIFPVASKSDVLLDLFPISNGIVKNQKKKQKTEGAERRWGDTGGERRLKAFLYDGELFFGVG